ncbi:hypothetical protein L1887_11981 [Cichorium endivia]|nr:hypothetical protein L1887_11981 [Cichorium endivia]
MQSVFAVMMLGHRLKARNEKKTGGATALPAYSSLGKPQCTIVLEMVLFVIHHDLAKSMETYYQESGRAGWDMLPSECLLYFRPADVPRQL